MSRRRLLRAADMGADGVFVRLEKGVAFPHKGVDGLRTVHFV